MDNPCDKPSLEELEEELDKHILKDTKTGEITCPTTNKLAKAILKLFPTPCDNEELVARFEKKFPLIPMEANINNARDRHINWLRTNLKPTLKPLDVGELRKMLKKYSIETLLEEQLIVELKATFGQSKVVFPEKIICTIDPTGETTCCEPELCRECYRNQAIDLCQKAVDGE